MFPILDTSSSSAVWLFWVVSDVGPVMSRRSCSVFVDAMMSEVVWMTC